MTSTEIAVFDTAALVPAKVFAPGGIDDVLAKLEAEVRATPIDISTEKGRKAVASLAYKVSRSKTALDDMGKTLVAGLKEKTAAIDAERKKARDRLDKLRDEVRKPLDDFEEAETARISKHESGIANFQMAGDFPASFTTDEIANRLSMVEGWPTEDFQEFAKRAADAKETTVARLKTALAESQKRDAERAELERLRQEAAERERQKEVERIEREKQEAADRAAAQAKAAAEAEAQRKAEEEAQRVAEEQRRREAEAQAERDRIEQERLRAEREKAEAEERAAKAEANRIAAEQRAKEAAEQAERDRVAAAEKAERDRVAAEQEAARRERQRIEDAQRAEREAAAKREADKAHKALINREAMAGLVAAGLSEAAAKAAVVAIAKGDVAHTCISY